MTGTNFVALDTSLETGSVERRELAGREHLVAPTVLVREMVLNGGYLPADEMARSVPGWNGVPVTVGHPQVDGQHVSANSPEFFESGIIGRIFNAEFVDDLPDTDRASGAGIRGEAWVDEQRAMNQGGDAAAIAEFLAAHADADFDADDGDEESSENQDGHVMDVSTGYFHELSDENGEFAGQEFDHVQLNLHPDHLAFLPDQEGACSVADGCGVPRVQARLDGDVGEAADVIADRVTDKLAAGGVVAAANSTETAADDCRCGRHDSNMDDIDIEALAEASPFSVDELDEMDDEKVASLHEAFTEADAEEAEAAAEAEEADADEQPADAEQTADAENETDADAIVERMESLIDDKFEAFQREQRSDDIEKAKAVLVDDGVDADALDALDPDTLVALAEKVEDQDGAEAPRGAPGVNWLGRGQPAANGDEPEDDHEEWVGQMGVLTRDPEGGD